MHKVVGVRFRSGCKIYSFDPGELELAIGDAVIVESEDGLGAAAVATDVRQEEDVPGGRELKRVLRKANEDDLRKMERSHIKESEAFKVCQQKILEREMVMKLVRVEWSFDNSKATFYFTADGRVDFRDLVKDLAHRFRIRIEMRQIGVRDEAKMLGGYGPCGRPHCCTSFLQNFEPVSIKMAKKQDLVLNPAKISGVCGRLMCCLGYEYSFYDQAKKEAARAKAQARTEAAKGEPAKVEAGRPAPQKQADAPGGEAEGDDKAAGKRKRKRSAWRKRRKKKDGTEGPGGAPAGDKGGEQRPGQQKPGGQPGPGGDPGGGGQRPAGDKDGGPGGGRGGRPRRGGRGGGQRPRPGKDKGPGGSGGGQGGGNPPEGNG